MKSFEYSAPASLKEAISLLGSKWGETEVLAGGTDLVTSLKQGLTSPARVVSLKNVAELKRIRVYRKKMTIGAMVSLGELAENPVVTEDFPAIAKAITGIGSPQMLNMATIGGDLCQRPRCWYYRHGLGLFAQKDGVSLVRNGDNRYHAIFGNTGPALFVSPSSLGTPLMALGASIEMSGKKGSRVVEAKEFFRTPQSEDERETVLGPSEVVVAVHIPNQGLKNATYEVRSRHGLDWPYVAASVAFGMDDDRASHGRVVLGHVAPVPWVSAEASNLLNGSEVDDGLAARCGEAAAKGASPLSRNGYKVRMVRTAVRRAVRTAANA